jgi:two-component system LytT family response regulator
MKAFLVDDEPIAIDRLRVLIREHGRVEVVGAGTAPAEVLPAIRESTPDVLFLDIEMPGLSGFELLEQLGSPQPVSCSPPRRSMRLTFSQARSLTCSSQSARRPRPRLAKLERVLHGAEARGNLVALLEQVRAALARKEPEYLVRVASRTGERVDFIDVTDVTHFYAKDKLTFAATPAKHYALDVAITDTDGTVFTARLLSTCVNSPSTSVECSALVAVPAG